MAQFIPKKIVLSEINGGNQYNASDGISSNAINDPIQAAAFVQSLAENQPDVSEVGEIGDPSVEIVYGSDGTPKFKFSRLKGEPYSLTQADKELIVSEVLNSMTAAEGVKF
jgi:hypothetical protein